MLNLHKQIAARALFLDTIFGHHFSITAQTQNQKLTIPLLSLDPSSMSIRPSLYRTQDFPVPLAQAEQNAAVPRPPDCRTNKSVWIYHLSLIDFYWPLVTVRGARHLQVVAVTVNKSSFNALVSPDQECAKSLKQLGQVVCMNSGRYHLQDKGAEQLRKHALALQCPSLNFFFKGGGITARRLFGEIEILLD